MRITKHADVDRRWIELEGADHSIDVIQFQRRMGFGAFMEVGEHYAIGRGETPYVALQALAKDVERLEREG